MPELDEPTIPQLDDNEKMGAEAPQGDAPKLNLLNHDDGASTTTPSVSDSSNDAAASARAAKKTDGTGGPHQGHLPASSSNLPGRSSPKSGGAGGGISSLMPSRRILAMFGIGGGFAMIIIAIMVAFSQLKIISLMETLAKHVLRRNNYMYEVRREAFMNEFFNKYLGETVAIDDSTATFSQQVMRRLHDGLEPRLREKYDIKVTASDRPGYKKIRIKDYATGEVTEFDTFHQKKEARRFMKNISKEITHDDGWVKRIWFKRRMTDVTGTRWRWLDPINRPYAKAVVIAENQLAKFLTIGSGKAAQVAEGFLSKILGPDENTRVTNEISSATSDEAAQIISKVLVKKALLAASGVGLVVTAVDVGCGISQAISDGSIQKAVKQYTELQYMTAYAAEQSKASQQKEGATNATAVAVNASLYAYKDDKGKVHDYTESNNYRRESGENVAYTPTDNCDTGKELCTQNLPKSRLDGSVFGGVLDELTKLSNSPVVQIFGGPLIPGSYANKFGCALATTVIKAALKVPTAAFDLVASQIPGYDSLKKYAADFIGKFSDKVVGALAGPVVDATTKGPFLNNALHIGGSLAAASAAGSPVGTTADDNACFDGKVDQATDASICGHKQTVAEVNQQIKVVMEQDQEDFNNSSPWTKIASLDYPQSIASRLISSSPVTFEQAVQNTQTSIMAAISPSSWLKIFKSLPRLFSAPTFAASTANGYVVLDDGNGYCVDQFGTSCYGLNDSELNAPLDDPKLKNIDRNSGCAAVAGLKDKNGKLLDLPPTCETFLGSGSSAASPSDPADLGKGDFVWPIDKQYGLISCWKNDRGNHLHAGIDITAPIGTPAHASADGTVEIANGTQDPSGYGNMVVINHGNGRWTLYGHLNEIGVSVGQKVKQGDVIGKTGNTGGSKGPHLHFNIQDQAGALGNAANPGTLNPLDYLPSDGRSLDTSAGKCGPGSTGYAQ